MYLSFLGIVILSLCVIGKAFYIQQFQGAYWKSLSDSLHLEYRPLDADRGTIYSEDGSMLSTSIPFFDIHIDFLADGLREKGGKRFKENIEFHPERDTVSYTQPVSYHFRQDLSVGSPSDVLTVINIPLVVSEPATRYATF